MYPFKEGSFAVRNGWYVAAFAHEVGRELLPRTILNTPVVLYRTEAGQAVAIGGRCPHRHFPLGQSCLVGDSIRCGYHGIAFGPDGACTDIPSQTKVPAAYRVPSYPLVEHGLWLFIWMGDPDLADLALLPPLEEMQPDGMHSEGLFFHEVKCRYQLLNDNLLDLTHLAHLHQKTIGVSHHANVPEKLTKGPQTLRSRRDIKNYKPSEMLATLFNHWGNIDSVVEFVFYTPGFHSGVGDHFVSGDDPDRPGHALRISRSLHGITPSTPTSTYYFFAVTSTDPAVISQGREVLGPVIEEDIFASEEIEKMLALTADPHRELMLKSDQNAVEGRRMLQALMDSEDCQLPHDISALASQCAGVEQTASIEN